MTAPQPRRDDRRKRGIDRRIHGERRAAGKWGNVRSASWQEQKVQFLTRFLLVVLSLIFFNHSPEFAPIWMTRWQLNAVFVLYGIIQSITFWHAWRHLHSVRRYRFAMWVDIAVTTIGVLNDPFSIPPSLVVYILVVLGNGMRYGMPFFAEALVGSFVGGLGALAVRQVMHQVSVSPGVLFLTLFAGIVLVYAYLLMGRIESSRRQLEQSNSTDTLTGLMNRRGLFEVGELMFTRIGSAGGRMIVMFADMDKFKNINDTYGHGVGDQVLRELGAILRETVRGTDIVARYGGDEFVLLLSDTSLDDAELVARRIQQRVNHAARERGLDYSVTIGLGEAPHDGDSFGAILENCDQALYQSKTRQGGGGVMRVARGFDSNVSV